MSNITFPIFLVSILATVGYMVMQEFLKFEYEFNISIKKLAF